MSYESIPQFTNQLAYQSVFAPPGFSFESPFAYPMISQPQPHPTQPMASGSGNGGGFEVEKQQLGHLGPGTSGPVPINRGPLNATDPMSSGSGLSSGYPGGHGTLHGQEQRSGEGMGEGSGLGLRGGMGSIGSMGDPCKSAWPTAEPSDKMTTGSLQ